MSATYGFDCFPPGTSHACRHFWLTEAKAILVAEERLKSGEASRDEVFDLALLVTGTEDGAREVYFNWLKAHVDAGVPVR